MPMCRLLQYASVSTALVALLLAATGYGVTRLRNQFAALAPAAMSTPGLEPLRFADTALEPIDWHALYGWAIDDHAAAFAAFQSSCRPLLRTIPPKSEMRPMYFALMHICRQAVGRLTEEQARAFFERNFRPLRITKLGIMSRS